MARIKIRDLPKDMKISNNDMRKITGGGDTYFGLFEKGSIIGPGPAPRPKGDDGHDDYKPYDYDPYDHDPYKREFPR